MLDATSFTLTWGAPPTLMVTAGLRYWLCMITLKLVAVSVIAFLMSSVVSLGARKLTPVTLKISSYSWKCFLLVQLPIVSTPAVAAAPFAVGVVMV